VRVVVECQANAIDGAKSIASHAEPCPTALESVFLTHPSRSPSTRLVYLELTSKDTAYTGYRIQDTLSSPELSTEVFHNAALFPDISFRLRISGASAVSVAAALQTI
jgi:hypothetical protein